MAARTENTARIWAGTRTVVLLTCLGLALPGCGGKSTGEWVEQLRSGDAADRLHAVKALGERIGEADVVAPALAETLRDADPFVRRDAAEALGKMGPSARPAVPALLAATQDRNPRVRQEAARALSRINPETGGRIEVR